MYNNYTTIVFSVEVKTLVAVICRQSILFNSKKAEINEPINIKFNLF